MRFSTWAIALFAVASAGAACAQDLFCSGSSTRNLSCSRAPGADANDQMNARLSEARSAADQAAAYGREMKAVRAANRRKKIGAMVAAGQCDQAMQAALKAGDFELANQVKGVCTPAAPAAADTDAAH